MVASQHDGDNQVSQTEDQAARKYAWEPELLQRGHRVQILVDGEQIFPAMLDAIANAQTSIWLESYIFESDGIGSVFIDALVHRARAGVQVLVLVDAFGGFGLSGDHENLLLAAGAELRFFGRFNHLRMKRWFKRDHRKLLLVDHRWAFVGGINISDDYAAVEQGGKGWHDIHVQLEGPVSSILAETFSETWEAAGGNALASAPVNYSETTSGERAMAICSNHRGTRMRIRRHLLHALRAAESEALIASAYFIPDPGLQRGLIDAAKRGVDVRVLVPGESDISGVQRAGEHVYERLLKAGVQVHLWPTTHMHAKTAAVDRKWCTFGSYNLDYVSLMYSLELVVEVIGDETPTALAEQLRADLETSPAIDLREWRRRSRFDKTLSSLSYQFRRWL
jgi:cardiolipin synthase